MPSGQAPGERAFVRRRILRMLGFEPGQIICLVSALGNILLRYYFSVISAQESYKVLLSAKEWGLVRMCCTLT